MLRLLARRTGGLAAVLPGLLLLAAILPSPVLATAAEWQIRSDTTLTQDFHGTIEITRDGVTLDCAGYQVIGDGNGRGIVVDKRSNVTVKNCDVSNFAVGIWIAGTSDSLFEGNKSHDNRPDGYEKNPERNGIGIRAQSVTGSRFVANETYGNAWDGMFLSNSTQNVIEDCSSHDNWQNGIELRYGSDRNTLTGNTAMRNVVGIHPNGSNGNTLTGNLAYSNWLVDFSVWTGATGNTLIGNTARDGRAGFVVGLGATNNTLIGNVSRDHELYGFWVSSDASGNWLEDNEATGNLWGFGLYAAHHNTLTGNVATADGSEEPNDYGFIAVSGATIGGTLGGATDNDILGNEACGSVVYDALQDADSTGNTWADNVFGTTSGITEQVACPD